MGISWNECSYRGVAELTKSLFESAPRRGWTTTLCSFSKVPEGQHFCLDVGGGQKTYRHTDVQSYIQTISV